MASSPSPSIAAAPQDPAAPGAGLQAAIEAQEAIAREQLEAAWQLQASRVEEVLRGGWRQQIATVFDERFAALREALGQAFDEKLAGELERRVSEAVREARKSSRRELGGQLNQAMRRLRQAEKSEDLVSVLVDSTKPYAAAAAIFSLSEGLIRGIRAQGIEDEARLEYFRQLEAPLESAAGFGAAIDSRDPMMVLATPGEISQPIFDVFSGAFGEGGPSKVCLFPLTVGQTAVAMLMAAGADIEVEPLEMLASSAAASLETRAALRKARSAQSDLVELKQRSAVAPPAPQVLAPASPVWSDLSYEEQELHLRAQRAARVLVAEMRLYRADSVRHGRAVRNLFASLEPEITSARQTFQEQFAGHAGMIDYLHQELVHTLANDDAALLGPEYPGRLC